LAAYTENFTSRSVEKQVVNKGENAMRKQDVTRIYALAAVLVLALSLIGCGGNPIEGTWEQSLYGQLALTWTFKSNGEFTVSASGASLSGTYTTSGSNLTLSIGSNPYGFPVASGTSSYSITGNTLNIQGVALTRK
jgi:hypothetical protein